MSTTVDQRVVSMEFDNKRFEQNASTTLSTLDRLKQSLNFSGASKGLNNLGTAVGNVNVSGLANSVDTVRTRFSAMEVMGVTALANITNSAVNAGKRIMSALTIDPVKTGFSEYETQINATQTILSNTQSKGTTIDDVNRALEELNKYADLTIYNFTEMTRNIGTFTAAGIDLDTSVNAIQGIANLAAVSGSTSQQASTAMYQLSQALATGTVKLMDWNSVVNAGMGGEMFQEALKETSRLLNTGADAAIEAEGSFRESLKYGWLTSEVLTETLKKFTTVGANERVAEYTGLSKEAVEAALLSAKAQYGEAEAIEHASAALANKSGKNAEEIKSILEFARNAEDAATKVKTFSQLWDVLKESAQSGWSQTWKIIVGDFEEAKALLTPLADVLTGFIGKMSDARNYILEGVMNFATPWKRIMDKLDSSGLTGIKKIADTVDEMTHKLEYFQDVVTKVWRGDYKNSDTGRYDLLDAAGYDHRVIQDLVNKGYLYEITMDDVVESHKKFGITMSTVSEEAVDLSEVLANLTDAQLREAGLTADEIRLFRELEAEARRTNKSISDLAAELSEVDGRTRLINSFKNVGSALVSVFEAMGTAWNSIFEPVSIIRLQSMIVSLEKFTEKIKAWSDNADTMDKLTRSFRGLFAILDIFTTFVAGGFKIAFKLLSAILGYFDMDILDLTARIGDAIVGFRDWIDSILDFDGAVEALMPLLIKAGRTVKGWFGSLMETEPFQNIMARLAEVRESVLTWISGLKETEDVPKYIFSGLINGLRSGIKSVVETIIKIGTAIITTFCSIFDIASPSKVFFAIGGFIIAGLIGGLLAGSDDISETINTLGTKIATWFEGLNLGSVFATILSAGITVGIIKLAKALMSLAAPLEGVGDVLSGTGEVLEKAARPIAKILKSTAKVIKGFARILTAISFDIATKGIKNLAVSLVLMAAAVAALAIIGSKYDLWGAVAIIATLATILATLALITNGISKASVSIGKDGASVNNLKSGLFAIAGALLMLGLTVRLIGSMSPEEVERGLNGIISMIVTLSFFLTVYGAISKSGGTTNIDKAGATLLKVAGAIAILTIVSKVLAGMEWSDFAKAGTGLAGMLAFITILALIGKIPGSNLDQIGNNLIKISGGIAILVIVAKLLAGMSWGDMGRAAVGLGGLLGVITLLMVIAMIPGKRLTTLGNNILKLSASIALLSLAAKIIASMSWGDMGKAAIGLVGLIAIVTGLVWAVSTVSEKEVVKVGATLLAASVAIGVLGIVLALLGMLDYEHLNKGIAAVGALGIIMSMLIMATSYAQDCKGNLIALTIAIGVLAVAVAALSFIPTDKLAGATIAIGVLIGIFALLVMASGKAQGSMGTLIVMTVAVGVLGGVLYLISTLPTSKALASALILSGMLLVMVGILALLSVLGPSSTGALVGVVGLLAMAVPLLAFVGILALMSGVENALNNALALTLLATAMTLLLIPLMLVGAGFAAALIGAGCLLAMAVPLIAFVGVLAVMSGVEDANTNANTLILLATAVTLLLVPLTLVGALWPAAAAGIIALAAMGIPLIEFVAIIKQMEGMDGAVENVMALTTLMESLTSALTIITALGPMALLGVAAIVGLAEFSDELPTLGTNLNKFAANLGTFDDTKIATVTCAMNAIGAICEAASKIDGQTEFGKMLFGDNSLSAFTDQLPGIGLDLKQFASNLGSFDESKIDTISCVVTTLKSLANMDLKNINKNLKDFGEDLGDFADDLSSFCKSMPSDGSTTSAANGIRKIVDAVKEIGSTSGKAVSDFTKSLKTMAKEGISAFVESFTDSAARSKIKNAASDMIGYFATAMSSKDEDIKTTLQDVASSGVSSLKSKYQSFYDAGAYLVSGFASGISENTYKAKAKATAMAEAAANAARSALNINSPSKVFMEIGSSIPEGFAIGIEKFTGEIKASSVGMSEAALSGVKDSISKIADLVSSDIDTQPTIRPILDLSDVESGASRIGSMFDSNASVGVLAHVGAISSSMNYSQNGSNSDVISAIDRLRESLGGMIGDTYQINGVTYEDGSAVSEAIQTIIRAAKIERRV